MGYETTTPRLEESFDATSFVGVEKEATTVAPDVRENSRPTNTKERKEVEDPTKCKYVGAIGELLDAIRKAATGDDKKPPLAPGQKEPLRPDQFGPAA